MTCPDCKGSGTIALLISTVPCEHPSHRGFALSPYASTAAKSVSEAAEEMRLGGPNACALNRELVPEGTHQAHFMGVRLSAGGRMFMVFTVMGSGPPVYVRAHQRDAELVCKMLGVSATPPPTRCHLVVNISAGGHREYTVRPAKWVGRGWYELFRAHG